MAVVTNINRTFATEIRHLQRTEVREVEEFFAKGQRALQQCHKRNQSVLKMSVG